MTESYEKEKRALFLQIKGLSECVNKYKDQTKILLQTIDCMKREQRAKDLTQQKTVNSLQVEIDSIRTELRSVEKENQFMATTMPKIEEEYRALEEDHSRLKSSLRQQNEQNKTEQHDTKHNDTKHTEGKKKKKKKSKKKKLPRDDDDLFLEAALWKQRCKNHETVIQTLERKLVLMAQANDVFMTYATSAIMFSLFVQDRLGLKYILSILGIYLGGDQWSNEISQSNKGLLSGFQPFVDKVKTDTCKSKPTFTFSELCDDMHTWVTNQVERRVHAANTVRTFYKTYVFKPCPTLP